MNLLVIVNYYMYMWRKRAHTIVLYGPDHPNKVGLFLSPSIHWNISTGLFCRHQKKTFNYTTLREDLIRI